MNIRNVKQLVGFLFIALVFTSCMSLKSFDKVVNNTINLEYLKNRTDTFPKISVKTDKLVASDFSVSSKKLSSYLIPAIVFWGWDNTIECKINKHFFATAFTTVLKEKTKEFQIDKYLANRILEINLESVPSDFVYSNNGNTIFLFVFYTYTYLEAIYPYKQELKIRYRILENGKELKSNVFVVNFSDVVKNNKSSSQVFIEKYVENLNKEFEYQSGQLIDKIIEDL